MSNKKGVLVVENVIFVVLTIIFFSIIIVFLTVQGDSLLKEQEKLTKEIVLLIDASRPGTIIDLDVSEQLKVAKENGISVNDFIVIDNEANYVLVRMGQDSFYDYSYFNDLDIKYRITNSGVLNMEVLNE